MMVEPNSDDQFAFIAGFTEGGAPFGVTWEELAEEGLMEKDILPDNEDVTSLFDTPAPWTPDLSDWPQSWMGIKEDLEYGRKLLPYFVELLQSLYDEGLPRKAFEQYRDHLWLLGGSIIRRVSNFEEYHIDPLEKLLDSVSCDGILPDHHDQIGGRELRGFSSMCRRFETYLQQKYDVKR